MKKVLMALSALALWSQVSWGHGGEESRIALEPNVMSMSAGSAKYKFQLIDTETNKLIGDLDLNIAHEKKLHLIIYDPSLQEFQHVHPEFDGTMWVADTQFSADGNYWVWAQGELASDGEEFSSSNRLDITGGTSTWPTPPVLGDKRTGSSGTSAIELSNTKLVAGKMAMLDLKMTRTDGTTPQLEPYLGAFAHLRMHMTPPTCRVRLERIQVDNIRQGEFAGVMCIGGFAHIIATPTDGDALIHVHPVGTGPSQGMIHATFPTAGEYRLWIQFIDNGSLKTIPLSVEVF